MATDMDMNTDTGCSKTTDLNANMAHRGSEKADITMAINMAPAATCPRTSTGFQVTT